MAVGFDPTQIAEQWKRRVDREEQGIVYGVRARPLSGMSHGGLNTGGRLDNLHSNLQDMHMQRYQDCMQFEEGSNCGSQVSRRSSNASAVMRAGMQVAGGGMTPQRIGSARSGRSG